MRNNLPVILCLLIAWSVTQTPADSGPAAQPIGPRTNLDACLRQESATAPAATAAATEPAGGANPFQAADGRTREDALPGVVELSDGTVLAGWLLTTLESPYQVFVESEKKWRRVPLLSALGVQAIIVEEKMEPRWRWKGMGEPERVYTGLEYPTLRLAWEFHLLDGSKLSGAVKGQPLWVQTKDKKHGPFILSERTKGEDGQKLTDLVYVKRIIVSQKLMEAVEREKGK